MAGGFGTEDPATLTVEDEAHNRSVGERIELGSGAFQPVAGHDGPVAQHIERPHHLGPDAFGVGTPPEHQSPGKHPLNCRQVDQAVHPRHRCLRYEVLAGNAAGRIDQRRQYCAPAKERIRRVGAVGASRVGRGVRCGAQQVGHGAPAGGRLGADRAGDAQGPERTVHGGQ